MLEIYTDIVRDIYKATGSKAPGEWVQARNDLHDLYEPIVLRVVQSILRKARRRMLRKRPQIEAALTKVHKSKSDDVLTEIRVILETSFAGAGLDLTNITSELVATLAKDFSSVYQVKLNFKLVNQDAVRCLEKNATNYFSTLSKAQAKGLMDVVANSLKDEDGYRITGVAKSILDEWLSKAMYFGTDQGSRIIGTTDWALITARTETARAASYGQQAVLQSLGLKTWQWKTQDSCDDECQDNDDEIVAIGDDFSSGDSEPPLHPQCRCIVLPVQDEMESYGNDADDSESEDFTNDTDHSSS